MQGEKIVSITRKLPLASSTNQMETKHYWKILKEEGEELRDAYRVFAREPEIWPDQCKRIIASLQCIEESIQILATSFKNSPYLSSSTDKSCYSFLLFLLQIDEQLQVVIPLFINLRTACRIASKQAIRQRNDAKRSLELLMKVYGDALKDYHTCTDKYHPRRLSVSHQAREL